ncbi:glycerophosphoryl diester phosphodiesterase [Winogradskyella arenosi]|uniref:Glycerophosphoryl diester phosphodiesterase n=2 Tax=Winogradskyella arenosi TaxID=533325 RepID=A0A368ZEF0_9FLAO|nr:glycerophosphoryl diester phosphodiesterase [Winogradskyella arenosi]
MMGCNSEKNIDVQGHRGCRGLMPENTLEAFTTAIDLGVETLELDIVISKDRKVVVSHEPYMNPVICLSPEGTELPEDSKSDYNLYEMDYKQIKAFDCGNKLHPTYPNQEKFKAYKPLLSEVFELIKTKASNVKVNIEIKSVPSYYNVFTPQPEAYVALVLEVIEAHQMEDRVNLQSFDSAILEAVKVQAPQMPMALLVDGNEDIDAKLEQLTFHPEIISPYFKLLSAENVSAYQAQGYKVIPWTVNSKADMVQMQAYQVDGIITDYPDVLINLLQSKESRSQ